MRSSDILVSGFDILLSILIVFVLAFFAIRYDENRGPDPEVVAVTVLDATESGDYEALEFVGLFLAKDGVWIRQYRLGRWLERGPTLAVDWQVVIDSEIRKAALPVVVYEEDTTGYLGDAVRLVMKTGQPMGIATGYRGQEKVE